MKKGKPVTHWVISDPAWESLDLALDLRKRTMSQKRMQTLVDEIFAELDYLVEYPGSGALDEQLAKQGSERQHWVVGHFKIIYSVVENVIWVSDIFDSRQDPHGMKG